MRKSQEDVLQGRSLRWLVTGCAGFIGSHLLENLLLADQTVVGLDNLSTGLEDNLLAVRGIVSPEQWDRCRFVRGDITNRETCRAVCEGVDIVLHQAAVSSVPYSFVHPRETHEVNCSGFYNLIEASLKAGVSSFVYASSSAVYGPQEESFLGEDLVPGPMSPYAGTKLCNELVANCFGSQQGMACTGLRYFNIYGPRQSATSAYAGVIPKWISELLIGKRPVIHGDGETVRDYCFIKDCVRANLLAALDTERVDANRVYNVGTGLATNLLELYPIVREQVTSVVPDASGVEPEFGPFRDGDIRYSRADIGRIATELDFAPGYELTEGMALTTSWYVRQMVGE